MTELPARADTAQSPLPMGNRAWGGRDVKQAAVVSCELPAPISPEGEWVRWAAFLPLCTGYRKAGTPAFGPNLERRVSVVPTECPASRSARASASETSRARVASLEASALDPGAVGP